MSPSKTARLSYWATVRIEDQRAELELWNAQTADPASAWTSDVNEKLRQFRFPQTDEPQSVRIEIKL